MTPKILVFSGSLRTGSYNTKLAAAAAATLSREGADVTLVSLADYPLPIMDQDLQNEKGVPENAVNLARQLAAQDGLFIASPEYNASVPPLVKNTIDWISRYRGDDRDPVRPFKGLVAGLGAASPGKLAGIRCLYHLRAVLMAVGAQVVTEQCGIREAADAFEEDGALKNEGDRKLLAATCRSLMEHAALSGRGR